MDQAHHPVPAVMSPGLHSLEDCRSIEDALRGIWGPDSDSTRSLTYNLQWDGEYLQDWLSRGEKLGDLFAITGNIFNAKGSTIGEYLEAQWGQSGRILLDEICRQYPSKDSFTLDGNYDTHMKYTAAAAWFCSAVRRSNSKQLSISRTSIYRSSNASPSLHFKPEKLQKTTPDYGKSCCWNPLFQYMVIVDDPSFEREAMKGIEISFEWMIHFTGGRVVQYGEYDFAIVGNGILLYTIQQDQNRIQMHLHNPEGFEAYSTRNSIQGPAPPRMLQLKHVKNGVGTLYRSSLSSGNITKTLQSKIFYIGWSEYVRINVGSSLLLAKNIGYSGQYKIMSTGEYRSKNFSMNFHTATIWSATIGMAATRYGTQRNNIGTIDSSDVGEILDGQKDSCSIIFNAATSTGYLIPTVRFYLFLAQIYILNLGRENIPSYMRSREATRCNITPDSDGTHAAIQKIRQLLREDERDHKERLKRLEVAKAKQKKTKLYPNPEEYEQTITPDGEVRWNILFLHIVKHVADSRKRVSEALAGRTFQLTAPKHIVGVELRDIAESIPFSRIVYKKIHANWTDMAVFSETPCYFYSDTSYMQPIWACPRPPLLAGNPGKFDWVEHIQWSEKPGERPIIFGTRAEYLQRNKEDQEALEHPERPESIEALKRPIILNVEEEPIPGLCDKCRRPPLNQNLLVTTGFCLTRILERNTRKSLAPKKSKEGKSRFAEYTDWIPRVRLTPETTSLLIPHGPGIDRCYHIQHLRTTRFKASGQPYLLQALKHNLNSGFIFGNEPEPLGLGAVSRKVGIRKLNKGERGYLESLEKERLEEKKKEEEKQSQASRMRQDDNNTALEKWREEIQRRRTQETARKEGLARKAEIQALQNSRQAPFKNRSSGNGVLPGTGEQSSLGRRQVRFIDTQKEIRPLSIPNRIPLSAGMSSSTPSRAQKPLLSPSRMPPASPSYFPQQPLSSSSKIPTPLLSPSRMPLSTPSDFQPSSQKSPFKHPSWMPPSPSEDIPESPLEAPTRPPPPPPPEF